MATLRSRPVCETNSRHAMLDLAKRIMSQITKIIPVVFCAILTGCAFNPQKAHIAPTVAVMASEEGAGVTVAVKVVDDRPSKSLGRRGTAYGAAAEITAAEEIEVVVQREVTAGLQKKGFNTTDFSTGTEPSLTIEIRLLEYSTSQGFWTGGVHVNGAIKAIARHNGDSYERMYRSENEERIMVVPTADKNEKWINSALSDVLNQLLNDRELIEFLKADKLGDGTA